MTSSKPERTTTMHGATSEVTAIVPNSVGKTEAGNDGRAGENRKSNTPHQVAQAERITKIGTVLGLLRRVDGATLAELVTSTGWLPHTTRAALTGLRKKGHVLDKTTRNGATVYSLSAVTIS